MKNGIHLQRSGNKGFYTQTFKNGRELTRTSELYARRAGALKATLSVGKLYHPSLVSFWYYDHTGDITIMNRYEQTT